MTASSVDHQAWQWVWRHRATLFSVVGLWIATTLVASFWPLAQKESRPDAGWSNVNTTPHSDILQRPDISAFAQGDRWGVSLQEIRASAEQQSGTALNPALQKIGFVGLISEHDRHAVVLMLPEVGAKRFYVGELLPDGRFLHEVRNQAISLRDADGNIKVLELFPAVEPGSSP